VAGAWCAVRRVSTVRDRPGPSDAAMEPQTFATQRLMCGTVGRPGRSYFACGGVTDRKRSPMLCIMCGAEMRLVEVQPDQSIAVPGFERHTWECSECQDVERRLTFCREGTSLPEVAHAPSVVPSDAPDTPDARIAPSRRSRSDLNRGDS